MQYKALELVNAEDLKALVGVAPETKRREYKEILPPSKGDDHKEFVNDVSSFANAEGGDLLFGVKEDRETHTAGEIVGIPTAEVESNIARLENLVRDGIRPRLPRFAMHKVEVGDGKTVLALRIGESHLAPHQNTLNHRFYSRNTNGKYIMEVGELRDMILGRESLPERIRAFRHARIDLIRNRPEDMPMRVERTKSVVVHFIPLQTFGRFDGIDMAEFSSNSVLRNTAIQNVFPVTTTSLGMTDRPNLDGFLFMNGRGTSEFPYYVQLFNDGSVEFLDTTSVVNMNDGPEFMPNYVENNLFKSYGFVQALYKALKVQGPIYVYLSLLGMRDSVMVLPNQYVPFKLDLVEHSRAIGADPALFNEVLVNDMKEDPRKALYPVIAQLWRAAAYTKPHSYKDDGTYIGVQG
ncbi:MAG TPA: ATP-binding protein [Candidatus Baltobacteraceae bacterium]|nr:ATP-binding protein [Candidatus Baltobacteraceae bacterium]